MQRAAKPENSHQLYRKTTASTLTSVILPDSPTHTKQQEVQISAAAKKSQEETLQMETASPSQLRLRAVLLTL